MNGTILWRTAWRLARLDLSASFRGLRLLLICLFLGVATLAAIGTLTGSIEGELASRGREILGGDIEAEVWQRSPSVEEASAFATLGKVSVGRRMQAMASVGGLSAPIALKSVDGNWPLTGTLRLKDGRLVGAPPQGTVWLAQGAAERLNIAPGDLLKIGGQSLRLGGIIAQDPEQLSEGFALGAVAIVPADLPARAGLTAPGAMYRTKIKVALAPDGVPDAAVRELERRFPESGFTYRTREHAAPGADRFVSRMGEFLSLVGLAALVIAGIGIGGGVASYLEQRRSSIATLKVLGATSKDVTRIYLLQVGAASTIGLLAGLVAGVLLTPLLASAVGSLLPVKAGFTVDFFALGRASAYGLLIAMVFAAPPLAVAKAFPAMAIMRAKVSPLAWPRKESALPVAGGLAGIVILALATSQKIMVTALFLAGAASVLALLALMGLAIRRLAAALPRPSNPILRTGVANLHRPGAQTGALVTAMGFGLSTFVLLAVVQTSLDRNIRARVPARAPDYFVLDVPRDRESAFRTVVAQTSPGAMVRTVPALRGKILAYGPDHRMVRVADLAEIPDDAWPLRGERGLTYAAQVPEGNTITQGRWWPADHSGEPLVSIEDSLAEALDLRIGDRLTIGLLGVERSARIASFRRIDWDSMGFNYVLVFSPNALRDAPHNLAATIELPANAPAPGLLGKLVRTFPSSSVIETGSLLRDARALLAQMSAAILAAASVTVLAGIAVLLGAIAAARASRTYDNVILRVLGASRRQLLLLQLTEYGLLAAVLAGVSLALGSVAGWLIIVKMFEFDWLPDWPSVFAVLAAGLGVMLAFALAASLPLLRAKPAAALREL